MMRSRKRKSKVMHKVWSFFRKSLGSLLFFSQVPLSVFALYRLRMLFSVNPLWASGFRSIFPFLALIVGIHLLHSFTYLSILPANGRYTGLTSYGLLALLGIGSLVCLYSVYLMPLALKTLPLSGIPGIQALCDMPWLRASKISFFVAGALLIAMVGLGGFLCFTHAYEKKTSHPMVKMAAITYEIVTCLSALATASFVLTQIMGQGLTFYQCFGWRAVYFLPIVFPLLCWIGSKISNISVVDQDFVDTFQQGASKRLGRNLSMSTRFQCIFYDGDASASSSTGYN